MSTSSTASTTAVVGSADAGPAGGGGKVGGERLVYIVCAAIIALHILLTAFVFVRPGTSWIDHLLAALVPVMILGLAADLWTRMPAGLRAILALCIGILALVSGGVAVASVRAEGVGGASFTGLLLLPAGAVLVGLGVWLLWVSRKRGGGLWWMLGRRALLAFGALVALYWVILPVSLAIVATDLPRQAVVPVDLGRPGKTVSVPTKDGLKLSGWYVPPENGAVVITFPRAWTAAQARMLVKHGYGVLMLDPRGYGDSQGDPNAYGWGTKKDVDAAVAWLRKDAGVSGRRIGGLGLSVGGEAMIEAAAFNPGLRAVVSEGAGIRTVKEALVRRGPSAVELALQFPQDLAQTIAVWLRGSEAPPPNLRRIAKKISPRAVFFIYGENGQETEKSVNPVYYDFARQPKEIWDVPGSGHTGGISAQPAEYERRVIGFFDRYLLGRK